jgi:hypothetical protein
MEIEENTTHEVDYADDYSGWRRAGRGKKGATKDTFETFDIPKFPTTSKANTHGQTCSMQTYLRWSSLLVYIIQMLSCYKAQLHNEDYFV